MNAMIHKACQFFSQTAKSHPFSMTVATATGSGLVGLALFVMLEHKEEQQQHSPKMTLEQARLRAMIENAQQSTWQENLENAVSAQEQFMLPGRPREAPGVFMDKIERRSRELLQQQQQDEEEEKKQAMEQQNSSHPQDMKDSTSIWK